MGCCVSNDLDMGKTGRNSQMSSVDYSGRQLCSFHVVLQLLSMATLVNSGFCAGGKCEADGPCFFSHLQDL